MAVCGASGFVAHPPMNIANATKAWTGHFIYATYSAARRQHLPCSTRSSYGLTRLPVPSRAQGNKLTGVSGLPRKLDTLMVPFWGNQVAGRRGGAVYHTS
jgi:hypothetical protein